MLDSMQGLGLARDDPSAPMFRTFVLLLASKNPDNGSSQWMAISLSPIDLPSEMKAKPFTTRREQRARTSFYEGRRRQWRNSLYEGRVRQGIARNSSAPIFRTFVLLLASRNPDSGSSPWMANSPSPIDLPSEMKAKPFTTRREQRVRTSLYEGRRRQG